MAAGKRKKGQSFKAYRQALREEEASIKQHLIGKIIWLSKWGDENGHWHHNTYVKAKNGPIGRGG